MIRIEPYEPKYKKAFFELNEQWITTYFSMEEPDRIALFNPETYILERGGFIFVATLEGTAVGVCALIKRDDEYQYELAKMAVAPEVRGRKIGYLLGQAVIEKARELNASRIFLESNTRLAPAIHLYEKLGFKKIIGPPTPYKRADIQMELQLIP
jgi:GNAT superfamily N-acetyltransferase